MEWATLLFIIVGGYVALKLIGIAQSQERIKFLGLTIAAVLFFIMQTTVFISSFVEGARVANISNFIFEWGHITCLAFVLSALAVFIRESKPVFAQFPMLYTALPLLIVISYILVKDTYALKNWLISIYQGGAITVALLMYSVYTYRRNEYTLILTGVIILLFCYVLYWYVPNIQSSYNWSWQLLLAAGMTTTVLGYEKAEKAVIATSAN